MKKLLLASLAALATFSVQAQPLAEGKQYVVVAQEHSEQPEVIEFFSFYCPHCYDFEMKYHIPQQIRAGLPANAVFKQYHVNFLGGEAENLTRAWALAMALGAEEKVKKPLFDAAQAKVAASAQTRTMPTLSMNEIRDIFLANGISAEQFDGGINSFAVNALVNKQTNLEKQYQVHGVPDFYINGKYRIDVQGLDRDNFVQDYVGTVKELLKK